jgi:hypothetical protein
MRHFIVVPVLIFCLTGCGDGPSDQDAGKEDMTEPTLEVVAESDRQ